jgi:excisionase family DNA binding protein
MLSDQKALDTKISLARAGRRVHFTTGEVSTLFGVSHRAVRHWCEQKKLAALVTPGGHRRIPGDQIIALLDGEGGHIGRT